MCSERSTLHSVRIALHESKVGPERSEFMVIEVMSHSHCSASPIQDGVVFTIENYPPIKQFITRCHQFQQVRDLLPSARAVGNLTFEYSPFPPEDQIMRLWRSFAKQGESYHTIGWFRAPSHVNLTITNPERKIVLDNLLLMLAIFGVLPVIWQISRRRNKRRLADSRERKQRKQKVRNRP